MTFKSSLWSRFACLLLVLALVLGLAVSAPEEEEYFDPWLGPYLVKGAATEDHLWLLNAHGTVVEFRRSDGARRLLARDGVVDMVRSGGRLLGVRRIDAQREVFQVFDLLSGASVSSSVALPEARFGAPSVVLVADDSLTLLTESAVGDASTSQREVAIYQWNGETWRRRNLTGTIFRYPMHASLSVATNNAGVIYVGYDQGEWGGGMWAIDPVTGTVAEVMTDRDPSGPWPFKEPPPARLGLGTVTGVARDKGRADCVLTSEGLMHMGGVHGRVLRACGMRAELIFSAPIPPVLSDDPRALHTWPFAGVAATADGWIAATPIQGFIFRSSHGVVSRSKLPRTRRRPLEWQSASGDVLIVITGANGAHPLSGLKPLLVPVTQ